MDEISIGYLLAAILLLFANALFVTAEFALVGLRRTKIEEMIGEGHRGAARVKLILSQLDSYLSTCQVGITLASLGLGWISEQTFVHLFTSALTAVGLSEGIATVSAHSLAVGIAFLLVTFLHVVRRYRQSPNR